MLSWIWRRIKIFLPGLFLAAGIIVVAFLVWRASILDGDDEGQTVIPPAPPIPIEGWHTGDVHTHAVGDAPLTNHRACERANQEPLPKEKCARHLVRLVLRSAKQNDLEWLVLSEHGPWLGVPGLFNIDDYEPRIAAGAWNRIKREANNLSKETETGIRALMGEEFGSAPPFSSSGHFNAYQIDEYIANDIDPVADTEYIRAVQRSGGWGAINHPFNEGNGWDCWFDDSFWFPHYIRLGRRACDHGATDYAPTPFDSVAGGTGLRAMEITNGGDFPRPGTLEQWEVLLQLGYRVWAVGGSDAHTLSRKHDSWEHGVRGLLGRERGVGRSKTFAYVEGYHPPGFGYDSTDPQDPIRQAILAGKTVASNAGFATAQVGDALPGGTVEVAESGDVTVRVRVVWQAEFTPEGKGPDSIRVILSQYGPECGVATCEAREEPRCVETGCGADVMRLTTSEFDEDHDQAVISVVMPGNWTRAYLRVEVLEGKGREPSDYGAFVSPMFLQRVA